jgi:hypothetical protein
LSPPGGSATQTATPELTGEPVLEVEKTSSVTTSVPASTSVEYTVTIFNAGSGPAYESVLVDMLVDQNGQIIYSEEVPLDDILANEEITMSYELFFDARTEPGLYTNTAYVVARGGHRSDEHGYAVRSPAASHTIEIITSMPSVLEEQSDATEEEHEPVAVPAVPRTQEDEHEQETIDDSLVADEESDISTPLRAISARYQFADGPIRIPRLSEVTSLFARAGALVASAFLGFGNLFKDLFSFGRLAGAFTGGL